MVREVGLSPIRDLGAGLLSTMFRRRNDGRMKDLDWKYPTTIEQLMIDIGKKEQNPQIEIVATAELIADICTRIVRLEQIGKNDE